MVGLKADRGRRHRRFGVEAGGERHVVDEAGVTRPCRGLGVERVGDRTAGLRERRCDQRRIVAWIVRHRVGARLGGRSEGQPRLGLGDQGRDVADRRRRRGGIGGRVDEGTGAGGPGEQRALEPLQPVVDLADGVLHRIEAGGLGLLLHRLQHRRDARFQSFQRGVERGIGRRSLPPHRLDGARRDHIGHDVEIRHRRAGVARIKLGKTRELLARLVHARHQLADLRFELPDARIDRTLADAVAQRADLAADLGHVGVGADRAAQRFDALLDGVEARGERDRDGIAQRRKILAQAMQQTVAALDVGDAAVERVDQFDEVLRRRGVGPEHFGEARHLGGHVLEVGGRQRRLPLERVDAVVDAAHALLDRGHAVLERLGLDRILDLVGEMHLEFCELAHRRGHIVEAPRQRLDIHLAALRHDLAEAGDLPFEPLDLSGLADGARQQLDHMRQLRHLVGDVLDVGAGLDLRLDFALEPLEPSRQTVHRLRQLVEHRRFGRTLHGAGGRLLHRRALALANLVDRRLQAVAWVGGCRRRSGGFRRVEPRDRPLHRTQRVAVPELAVVGSRSIPRTGR